MSVVSAMIVSITIRPLFNVNYPSDVTTESILNHCCSSPALQSSMHSVSWMRL